MTTAVPARREGVELAAWGAVCLIVAVVRNRLWATPNLAFFTLIAERLGHNPFGGGVDGDYLLTNLAGPALARALGQTEPHEYVRLHLAVMIVGCAAVVIAAARRFGFTVAKVLCLLLAAAPATTVVMEWLGQPDALTLPLALGLVVARRAPTRLALGVALGLTHPEQGLVAAVVAVVVAWVVDGLDAEPPIRLHVTMAAPVAGVVVGRAVTEVYLRLGDMVVTKPRTAYLDLGVSGFVDHHLRSGGWLVYALWGPLWLVVVAVAVRRFRTAPRSPEVTRGWLLLGLTAIAAVVPVLVTLDETRVYSLVTAPLLVGAAVLTVRTWDLGAVRLGHAIAAVLVVAIVPAVFTAGEAYWAWNLPPRSFARFLVDGTHPDDLTGWLLEPFGFEVPTVG